MNWDKVYQWISVLFISLPWIIVILCCIAGGKITFESDGLINQIQRWLK